MNKKQKSSLNLFFSAFLIVAYVICAYFFGRLIENRVDNATTQNLFNASIYLVFGLVLFYATRVGDGKQIVRFSLSSLVLLVTPSIYVLCCYFFRSLPFARTLTLSQEVINLASVILGYGLPYTFTSGFELEQEDEPEADEIADKEKEQSDSTEDKSDDTASADEIKEEDTLANTSVEDVKREVTVTPDDDGDDADDEIDSLDL